MRRAGASIAAVIQPIVFSWIVTVLLAIFCFTISASSPALSPVTASSRQFRSPELIASNTARAAGSAALIRLAPMVVLVILFPGMVTHYKADRAAVNLDNVKIDIMAPAPATRRSSPSYRGRPGSRRKFR